VTFLITTDLNPTKEISMSLKEHIEQLRSGAIARTMLKVGDRAPAIVLNNADGETVDVAALLKKGPVIVTFYRGGWCPYCNFELKAYQEILPEIRAAGASLVAISPETGRHVVDYRKECARF
jgi:peroxiredoxin